MCAPTTLGKTRLRMQRRRSRIPALPKGRRPSEHMEPIQGSWETAVVNLGESGPWQWGCLLCKEPLVVEGWHGSCRPFSCIPNRMGCACIIPGRKGSNETFANSSRFAPIQTPAIVFHVLPTTSVFAPPILPHVPFLTQASFSTPPPPRFTTTIVHVVPWNTSHVVVVWCGNHLPHRNGTSWTNQGRPVVP